MTSVRMNLECSCRLCRSPNAELSVAQARWQAVLTLLFRPSVTLPADRENVYIFLPEERKDPPFNSTCLLYTKSLVFSASRPWREQFSSLSYCQVRHRVQNCCNFLPTSLPMWNPLELHLILPWCPFPLASPFFLKKIFLPFLCDTNSLVPNTWVPHHQQSILALFSSACGQM